MQLNSKLAVLQNKLELLGTNSDSELLVTYKQQNEQIKKHADDLRNEIKNVSCVLFLFYEMIISNRK